MGRGGKAKVTSQLPRLPVTRIDELSHLGTLDPADKGKSWGGSYEGHGLSVSLDPDEWAEIARLGGSPRWTLSKEGGKFLSYHELSTEQIEQISDWAVSEGLAERESCWEVSYFDSELDDEVSYLSEFEPEKEGDEVDGHPGALLRQVEELAPTPLLEERLGMKSQLGCFDHVLVLWVEETRPELDGVWWEDAYAYLSAPRGVIVPNRLAGWEKARA